MPLSLSELTDTMSAAAKAARRCSVLRGTAPNCSGVSGFGHLRLLFEVRADDVGTDGGGR